jgi:hypothetical protein
VYRPVIRTEPRSGHAAVTWAEFVEAGLLREYRQTHRVPMAELRAFIDQVRSEFGVPYPLAHQRPFVSGKELLSVAQDATDLDADLCLVAIVHGQYVLTPAADAFYKRVTWEGDTAIAWRPHDDPLSPVRMQRGLRSGRPAVKGISTEILWEHEQAGEAIGGIAEEYDLSDEDAKILVQLRGDVTYPGDPGGPVKGGRVRSACTIIDPATIDEVWIPETARQEWLIITRRVVPPSSPSRYIRQSL